MQGLLILLDGRVRMGAFMAPGVIPPELPPPNPESVLLETGTGKAILTSPLRQFINITVAPVDFIDPDAIIFYFICNRASLLTNSCGFEWVKIGTLPDSKLKVGFPTNGSLVMAAGQTQLPIPLVLESRDDLGQGWTLGVRIFNPLSAVIEDDREERTI